MAEITTVTGPLPSAEVALADGHGHAWIDPPADAAFRLELRDEEAIVGELQAFREAGGTLLVDCQPGSCGRDARALRRISLRSGVRITTTTGFHQRRYYPPGAWIWSASSEAAAELFLRELREGVEETVRYRSPARPEGEAGASRPGAPQASARPADTGHADAAEPPEPVDEPAPVRAATVKVGYEGVIEGQTEALMEAAAQAARVSGALLLFHTERGRNVEALIPFFGERGVPPRQLYLCHVDKRPDLELHLELARAGALLGYDTFIRPKYDPERGAWRLLEGLAAAGLAGRAAVGLDLALPSLWRSGGGPGPVALVETVVSGLRSRGFTPEAVRDLTAANIARALAGAPKEGAAR